MVMEVFDHACRIRLHMCDCLTLLLRLLKTTKDLVRESEWLGDFSEYIQIDKSLREVTPTYFDRVAAVFNEWCLSRAGCYCCFFLTQRC